MGKRIGDLTILPTGNKIEPSKKYVVGGWGSINSDVQGPAIFDMLENYISEKKLVKPNYENTVKIMGI